MAFDASTNRVEVINVSLSHFTAEIKYSSGLNGTTCVYVVVVACPTPLSPNAYTHARYGQ